MPADDLRPAPSGAFAVRPLRVSDLELFWPSRRGHAFDEFCR
ncbi:hypothetical protein ACFQH9_13365 [Pseudonocardia lutea]|jgi:hypothetical protein|uniref:GNAT family N-acetyltransferase n=1 Tax=Pseudonocardia lutea TaxID=2172015 RepID=A0ABW1IA47_9PSEU